MRSLLLFASCLLGSSVSAQFGGPWSGGPGGPWNPQAAGGGPNFGGYQGDYQNNGDYGRQFDEPRKLPLALPGVPIDGNVPVDPFLGPMKPRQQQVPARAVQINENNRRKDAKNNQQAHANNDNHNNGQNGQQSRSSEQQPNPMRDLDNFYKSLTGELTKTPNGMGLGVPEAGQMAGPNY